MPDAEDPLASALLYPEKERRLAAAPEAPVARPEPPSLFAPAEEPPAEAPGEAAMRGETAPLGLRLAAACGDVALAASVAAAGYLGAANLGNGSVTAAGIAWTGAFALFLTAPVTVTSLALFGQTPGMALAGVCLGDPHRSPHVREAAVRWLATLATAALAGLPLLSVAFDPARRTPADLLSGRSLRTCEADGADL